MTKSSKKAAKKATSKRQQVVETTSLANRRPKRPPPRPSRRAGPGTHASVPGRCPRTGPSPEERPPLLPGRRVRAARRPRSSN